MCPLQSQCVAGSSGLGRTVQLHPREGLLQQSEAFSDYRQRRMVVVEYRLARLVQLEIRSPATSGVPRGNSICVPSGHGGQPDPKLKPRWDLHF